jgi:hypothetical protein
MKLNQVLAEKEHKSYHGPDLSNVEKSLTKKLTPFISKMSSMDYEEIKSEFVEMLNSKDISLSPGKRKYYFIQLAKKLNKDSLMKYITDVCLAGSGESVIQ